MSVRFSKVLKGKPGAPAVAPTIREYEDRSRNARSGGLEDEKRDYREFNDLYYDLATDCKPATPCASD